MSRQRKDTETLVEPPPPAVKTYLVRWRCPDCGIYVSGYIRSDDEPLRVCRGNARIDAKRVSFEICGGIMTIAHDERPGRRV